MIKLILCLKRQSLMSRAEFQDYWLKHHGPLFQRFAETYRAVRYVQSHTIDSPLNENLKKSRGMSDEYDGIAEIWWQSEEDFLAAISSPEGQKLRTMFIEDEAKFVNLSASSAFFTVEHVIVDGVIPNL
ncbi:MAG: EthD domain-containing protein [bacterium]